MFILETKATGETIKEFSNRIKVKYNAKHAAICGKLDPMARGLTTILLDDNTKLMDSYLNQHKSYQFNLIIGIKTNSDDILGNITDYRYDIGYTALVLDYVFDKIANQTLQKFHPFSAKRVTIQGLRKPLHHFSRMGLVEYDILPEKKASVERMRLSTIDIIDFREYREKVLEFIGKLSNESKIRFNAEEIVRSWNNIEYTDSLCSLKMEMTVSSGYYIRMIAYEIYRNLGIPCHIFDIHRVNT